MGANNVARSLGFKWGFVVWFLDGMKGVVAVAIARQVMWWDGLTASIVAALSVIIGHNWSLLASLINKQIRGGKGVSTAGGTWLMLVPFDVFCITAALWVILILGTRYVSLAVLIVFLVGTLWVMRLVYLGFLLPPVTYYAVTVTGLIYYRHRENIRALLQGRERRFMLGSGKKAE